VTVASDSKIFLFNGATGEKLSELKGGAPHTGSIFSVSWSPDSNSILTASADKTVKIWDVATGTATTYVFVFVFIFIFYWQELFIQITLCFFFLCFFSTFTFGNTVDDMQVGSLWQGNYLLSLSLSGDINYLDKNSSSVSKVIKGHTKPIMSLATKDKTIFTGDVSGRIGTHSSWNLQRG